jgi:hypothetical protein
MLPLLNRITTIGSVQRQLVSISAPLKANAAVTFDGDDWTSALDSGGDRIAEPDAHHAPGSAQRWSAPAAAPAEQGHDQPFGELGCTLRVREVVQLAVEPEPGNHEILALGVLLDPDLPRRASSVGDAPGRWRGISRCPRARTRPSKLLGSGLHKRPQQE